MNASLEPGSPARLGNEVSRVPLVSRNMEILKSEYGFDTVALRRDCLRMANVETGSMVLDMGTGSGWMAIAGAMVGLRIISVDISNDAIVRARERAKMLSKRVYESIRFSVASGVALPFKNERFDGVVSFDALHHLADYSCPPAIRELLRVCRRGGRVVLSDLSAKGMAVVNDVIARSGDIHECNRCPPSRIPSLLDSAGLKYAIHDLGYANAYVLEK